MIYFASENLDKLIFISFADEDKYKTIYKEAVTIKNKTEKLLESFSYYLLNTENYTIESEFYSSLDKNYGLFKTRPSFVSNW